MFRISKFIAVTGHQRINRKTMTPGVPSPEKRDKSCTKITAREKWLIFVKNDSYVISSGQTLIDDGLIFCHILS
ncbi:hypothetical protein SAMN05443582_101270 [Phyllobacterium sp. OV277]|nr:hypothetical protein SAMN05443582_101270 [Phyllobacterium sp. OV277]